MNYNNLIGINDVAKYFSKSIPTIRNYKAYGIIEPIRKDGNKELYSFDEIKIAKDIVDMKSIEMKLAQIAELIKIQRNKHRKKITKTN